MSITNKLTTVAENTPKVYEAGQKRGYDTTMTIIPKSDTATTANVTVIGKNLCNVDAMCNADMVSNGDGSYTLSRNDGSYRFSRRIPIFIPGNQTFSISVNILKTTQTTGNWVYIIFFGSSGQAYYSIITNNKETVLTYTEDITQVQLYLQSTEAVGIYTTFNNLQIALGSDLTDYEPYAEYANQTATVGETITIPVPTQNMTIFTTTSGVTLDVTYPKEV